MSVGDEYAFDLAQDLMRVIVKLKYVRQDDEIDAVGGKGQFPQVAQHVDVAGFSGNLAQGDPVVGKQRDLGQSELQRVVPEEVVNHGVDLVLFPGDDVASLRRRKPLIDSGY